MGKVFGAIAAFLGLTIVIAMLPGFQQGMNDSNFESYLMSHGYTAYADPSGNLYVPGSANVTGNIYTNLTNGRVPIVGAGGVLTSDPDLSWSGGNTLNAATVSGTQGTFTSGNFTTLGQSGFQVPTAPGVPDYIVGVNTAGDDVAGSTGYWVKSGATGQVVETNASASVAIQWVIDACPDTGAQISFTSGLFSASGLVLKKGIRFVGTANPTGNSGNTFSTRISLNADTALFTGSGLAQTNAVSFSNIVFDGNGYTDRLFDLATGGNMIFEQCLFQAGIPSIYAIDMGHMRFLNCVWGLCGSAVVPQITAKNSAGSSSSDWWFESCTVEPCAGDFLYSDISGGAARNFNFYISNIKAESVAPNYYSLVTGDADFVQIMGGQVANMASLVTATLNTSVITKTVSQLCSGVDIVLDGSTNTIDGVRFISASGANHITLATGSTDNEIINCTKYDATEIPLVSDLSTAKTNIIRNNQRTVDYPQFSPLNLLANGNFETGDPPTSWTASNPNTALAQSAVIKVGSGFSINMTRSAPGAAWHGAVQALADYAYYKGKWVSCQVYIYGAAANTLPIKVLLGDGVADTESAVIPSDDAWHLVQLERLISASATKLQFSVYSNFSAGDAAFTVFADRAGLYLGRLQSLPDAGADIVGP